MENEVNRTAMSIRLTSTLILFAAVITSALGAPMKKPDIKQNSRPTMRYALTVTVDGAPGPFDAVSGSVDYKVSNGHCVPLTPISGATIAPENHASIALTRVSEHVYTGTIYADLMQDDDYYGMGVCHWSAVAAAATFKVNAMSFSPAISLDEIVAQKSVTRFFSNRSYLSAEKGSTDMLPVDTGESSAAAYKPELQGQLFSITLSAKEAFQ